MVGIAIAVQAVVHKDDKEQNPPNDPPSIGKKGKTPGGGRLDIRVALNVMMPQHLAFQYGTEVHEQLQTLFGVPTVHTCFGVTPPLRTPNGPVTGTICVIYRPTVLALGAPVVLTDAQTQWLTDRLGEVLMESGLQFSVLDCEVVQMMALPLD